VIAYGWLLASTDALPYVIDNNESFSAYFHGANMFRFGLGASFGLTDEAVSPDAAAHPYVYTHGGNFPRVFTYLLYALGARTVQAQIVIATFTIGALGLFFVYAYFARLAGVGFAALTCVVFGTDYLFFAQWQVNSYRVWHTFFLFAALLCVHGVGGKRQGVFLGLLFATEACLVYFDLTFALFVSLFAALYAAALYHRQLGLLVLTWAVQFLAALTAAALLVSQSVAYLGWSAFVFDFEQTYGSRNNPLAGTGAGDQLLAQLQAFYASRHVVFWHLLGTNQPVGNPAYFARELFTSTLQPMTTVFSLIVLLLCAGWLAGLAPTFRLSLQPASSLRGSSETSSGARLPRSSAARTARAALCAAALGLAVFVAALATLLRSNSLGDLGPVALTVLAAVVACVTTVCLAYVNSGFGHTPVVRVTLASGVLLLAAAFIWNAATIYDQAYQPLDLLGAWLPDRLATCVVLVTLGIAAGLALHERPVLEHRGLVVYLACGLVAYIVCYAALPGYVISAYLERAAPLTVYGRDVAVAIAVAVLATLLVRAARELRAPIVVRGLASGAAAVLLVGMGAYWLNVQREYVRLLPPTHYAFLSQLGDAPFRGASFATNMYPASVAAQTGQWAYTDQALGGGEVDLENDGYQVARDLSYLWVADAQTNSAYAAPEYYLCVIQQSLLTAVQRLAQVQQNGCGQLGLVKLAGQDVAFPHDKVVAGDPSGRDGWSIVRLDWQYPPYLAALDSSGSAATLVRAEVQGSDGQWRVKPDYKSMQQTGVAQQPAMLRLYETGSKTCLIGATDDPSGFVLPAAFSNLVTVSVTPRTAAAVGQEFFSQPFYVGSATYLLPDGRGGYQQMRAGSVEEAEQRAAAEGAWDPRAAAGMSFFTLPDIQSGNAQQVLAHSLDEAEKVAEAAGTWNQKAGTYGVTSLGATLSKGIEKCQS
jgi:hypothetical protein